MSDAPSTPTKTVRNAQTGQYVTVRGAGALRGGLTLKKGVDLTKPIFEQVVRRSPTASGKKR